MRSARRCKWAPRSSGLMRGHGPSSKATLAAVTARAASCADPRTTLAQACRVVGLTVANHWSVVTGSPSMRWVSSSISNSGFQAQRSVNDYRRRGFACGVPDIVVAHRHQKVVHLGPVHRGHVRIGGWLRDGGRGPLESGRVFECFHLMLGDVAQANNFGV